MPISSTAVRSRPGSATVAGVLFFFAVLISLLLFFIPAWIIQPFRTQTPARLNFAFALRQQAPPYSLLAAIVVFGLTVALWRRVSRVKRLLLTLGLSLASASVVMVRVDYFEWMFHPISSPGFESASLSKLDPSQMVLSVSFAGQSRAYPIYEMAYHHVLNDTVAGVPVAVTY